MTEMAQQTEYEAVYISESFGIPLTAALKITQATARKRHKAKAKEKPAAKTKRRK